MVRPFTAIIFFLLLAVTGGSVQAETAPNVDGFLGTVWKSESLSGSDPLFGTIFSQVTPENSGKWGVAEPTEGNFNWGSLDAMYALGASKNLVIKHHVFVWGQQQPSWVNNANAQTAVTNWMTAYMKRYGDKMDLVEVVNEALKSNAQPTYKEGLGGAGATKFDWVIWSFQKARDLSQIHAPNTRLILNDYNLLNNDGETTRFIELCNLLKNRGLLDAIGEQAHFFEAGDIGKLRHNLHRLGAVGVPLYITEFDLDIADDDQHSKRFKELFTMFWEHARVRGVTLWGHKQGQMWRQNGYLVRSDGTERPALTWLRGYLKDKPLPGKGNLPPTAAAGADGSLTLNQPSNKIKIFGEVGDDQAPGTALTQSWSVVSGPGPVTFTPSNGAATEAAFKDPGTYTLRLTCSDGVFLASDDLVVVVNVAPVAKAGADQVIQDSDGNGEQAVMLDGSGSFDPDGTIDRYQWKQNDVLLASGMNPKLTVNLKVGSHTLELHVKDRYNGWSTDTVTVTVTANALTAPAAPSNLTATAISSTQINLAWTDNANNETGFKVERATAAGGPFTLINTTAANATTYNSTGLTAETQYFYRVSATKTGAPDSAAITTNATTQGSSATAPKITTQPMNQTVTVGATATFTVVTTGTPAPTYQWRKGGTDIGGATSASYTTSATVIGDNGAQFSVVVKNTAGEATSTNAILTVNAPGGSDQGGSGSSGGGGGGGGCGLGAASAMVLSMMLMGWFLMFPKSRMAHGRPKPGSPPGRAESPRTGPSGGPVGGR